MKKSYVVALVVFGVLLAAYGLCSLSCCKKGGIAVVDVQRLASQAQPVAELRQDMQNQMSNLQAWVDNSNAEINAAAQDKKDELTKQYQQELLQKQQAIQSDYATKLQQIDSALTKIIEETAKAEGFDVTLVKGSVAAGGTDITEKVLAKLAK